ncbi:unnamed protein product [Sphagnum tenellum]
MIRESVMFLACVTVLLLLEPPRVLVLRLRLHDEVVGHYLVLAPGRDLHGVHLGAEVSAELLGVLDLDLGDDELGALVRRAKDVLEEGLGELGHDVVARGGDGLERSEDGGRVADLQELPVGRGRPRGQVSPGRGRGGGVDLGGGAGGRLLGPAHPEQGLDARAAAQLPDRLLVRGGRDDDVVVEVAGLLVLRQAGRGEVLHVDDGLHAHVVGVIIACM